MKPSTKIILSVMLSLLTMGFIVVWGSLQEKIDSTEVLIVPPNTTIYPHEIIAGDEFIVENRSVSSVIDEALTPEDLDSIVGYSVADLLVGNQMVSRKQIDFEGVNPDPEKGEAIRPIPDEWIYSEPGSLRRKDRIDIYVFKHAAPIEEIKKVITQINPSEGKSENLDELELIEKSQRPLLKEIPVVYAKDRSNKEVVDHSQGESRMNATGQISDLELNMNDEDFSMLISYVREGYRLYITYN